MASMALMIARAVSTCGAVAFVVKKFLRAAREDSPVSLPRILLLRSVRGKAPRARVQSYVAHGEVYFFGGDALARTDGAGVRFAPRVRTPSAWRWRRDLSNDSGALVVVKCLFDIGNLAHNRPIPENRCGHLLPRRVWRVEDCIIPEVSLFHAAIGCGLPSRLSCSSIKFLRYQMVGIPELLCSRVGDSCKGATTGGTPIRGEDWLPHYQYAELGVRIGAQ